MALFELEQEQVLAATHKTSGIEAIEWRRLFDITEQLAIDELRDNINNPSYVLEENGVSIDDPADALNLPVSYRKFLRTCFYAFDEATSKGRGINVDDELTFPSLVCFEVLGILEEGRKGVIIQGVPLT